MDTSGIGRRIAYWRERRRMTQADFGALMGKSRRWVQDIEGGHRQTDPRLSVLERAAEVLQVRLEALLTDEALRPAAECVDASELAAIRAALQRDDVLTGSFDDVGPDSMALEPLRRNVAYGWMAFQASDYSPLGRVLPPLIIDASQAVALGTGEELLAAQALLSSTYQLTTAVAIKFGDEALAWHAADRGVVAAERSANPLMMAAATRLLCDAMFHRGDGPAAVSLAIAVARRLEPELSNQGAAGLSVLGMLYLKASMAAAHIEARSQVPDLLDAAGSVATQLGHDGNAMWTAFGPTNVQLHRVEAAVRMNDGGDAVNAADQLTDEGLAGLPRERRANFLVEVARGLSLAGRREAAVDKLLDAEREAPEEVHCRPRAKRLIEDLELLGVGSAERRLRALAGRCGLPT